MPEEFEWLPPLLLLAECDEQWEEFLNRARLAFDEQFLQDRPPFRGMRMGLKLHPPVNGENCTFWHLCTFDPTGKKCPEEDREWDEVRIERIRWPAPIVAQVDGHPFRIWEEERRRGERRIHIWFVEEDYVFILARRHDAEDGDYVLPWATFVLQRDDQREEYERRYRNWA